jgi:hypothetical protein
MDRTGVRGGRLKNGGGGGGDGVGLVHDQAGGRYTRIPDPAHVPSARGWARRQNIKQIITG